MREGKENRTIALTRMMNSRAASLCGHPRRSCVTLCGEGTTMPSYMFDTNIFNRILDGVELIEITKFYEKAHFYATHIQLDELKATSNTQRRQELIAIFKEIAGSKKVLTD